MSTELQPPPLTTPIVELSKGPGVVTGAMTRDFASWLRAMQGRVQRTGYSPLTAPVALENQSASIGLTPLIASASGLYRVHYRFRVSQAATTSSSLLVTITTTDGAITVTQSSAAYTGNVTGVAVSGTFLVRADPSSPLSYSTVYASVGGTVMKYALDIVVESL